MTMTLKKTVRTQCHDNFFQTIPRGNVARDGPMDRNQLHYLHHLRRRRRRQPSRSRGTESGVPDAGPQHQAQPPQRQMQTIPLSIRKVCRPRRHRLRNARTSTTRAMTTPSELDRPARPLMTRSSFQRHLRTKLPHTPLKNLFCHSLEIRTTMTTTRPKRQTRERKRRRSSITRRLPAIGVRAASPPKVSPMARAFFWK